MIRHGFRIARQVGELFGKQSALALGWNEETETLLMIGIKVNLKTTWWVFHFQRSTRCTRNYCLSGMEMLTEKFSQEKAKLSA